MYVGIIYNWKGLKEENYLYTLDELAEVDFKLLVECLNDPTTFILSQLIPCSWKTWEGRLLKTEEEVIEFLSGKFNDDAKCNGPDWYWENCVDNDLYGKDSYTMSEALERFIH